MSTVTITVSVTLRNGTERNGEKNSRSRAKNETSNVAGIELKLIFFSFHVCEKDDYQTQSKVPGMKCFLRTKRDKEIFKMKNNSS